MELEIEFRIIRPDGTIRWISDNGYPVRDGSGQPYRIVGIMRDITDRKNAEEQLVRHNALLRAINQAFETTLDCQTDSDVARACLVIAQDLTGSEFGCIIERDVSGERAASCIQRSC